MSGFQPVAISSWASSLSIADPTYPNTVNHEIGSGRRSGGTLPITQALKIDPDALQRQKSGCLGPFVGFSTKEFAQEFPQVRVFIAEKYERALPVAAVYDLILIDAGQNAFFGDSGIGSLHAYTVRLSLLEMFRRSPARLLPAALT